MQTIKQIQCFFCVWLFCCTFQANAQRTLSGTVRDAETGELLEAANVMVLRGRQTAAYAISNDKGEFSIPLHVSPDTLTLSVSMMGYNAFSEKIGNRSVFQLRLAPSPILLKEVTIRPGRIWGRSDTIRYDASKFLRENDRTVEELMKRLPGIQVDDDGKIQYKGKEIGTMYVEGLDLMDGRYKSVSRNIPAQSVREVEVLDNHQRIKSLAGKISSDIADINIKLKDNFKDKWKFNPEAAAGFSADDFLYEAEANALQIARKSQSLYALKLSDTGNGITKEADKGMDDLPALPDYRLLQPGSVSAPLREKRWLLNDAAIATGNRLYRIGDNSRVKLNAFYSQDEITLETSSMTTYLNPDDTLTVDENKNRRLQGRKLNIAADYEDNAFSHYLRNKLDFNIHNYRTHTGITGSYNVTEQHDNESLTIRDNFNITRTTADNTVFQLKSVIGFWQHRQQLAFENRQSDHANFTSLRSSQLSHSLQTSHSSHSSQPSYSTQPSEPDLTKQEQTLLQKGFYAYIEQGWIISKTKIRQLYSTGTSIDLNNLMNYYRVWATPSYEYLYRSMKFNLGVPLQFALFPGYGNSAVNGDATVNEAVSVNGDTSGSSGFLVLPGYNFRADCKLNYAWNARFLARYGKEFTDITAFYLSPYFSDYRTLMENDAGVPVTAKHSCTLRAEYKNTLKEFFATIDLAASVGRVNHTVEQTAEGGIFRWIRRYAPHNESSFGVNTVLSKGFYDRNANMSLETSWGCNRSAQLRNNTLFPFTFRNLLFKPVFNISPTKETEVTYSGELQRIVSNFGNNASTNGLWNMSHKASFSYIQRRFDITLTGDYFRNEISQEQAVRLFFADLAASVKFRRLTLQLQLNNLLNHRDYGHTMYNPLSIYSSRIGIRPRELLVQIKMAL